MVKRRQDDSFNVHSISKMWADAYEKGEYEQPATALASLQRWLMIQREYLSDSDRAVFAEVASALMAAAERDNQAAQSKADSVKTRLQ